MKKNEIIKKLEELERFLNLEERETKEKYPYLKTDDIYPFKVGYTASEIKFIIEEIKK